MIKATLSDSSQHVQIQALRNEFNAFRRESSLSKDAKGSPNGDNKEFGEGHRNASRQQNELGAALFQRFTLFERQLLEAGTFQSRRAGGDQTDKDSDTNAGERVVQILFESASISRNEGPASAPPQSGRASLDARVERIFAQVAMQVDSAIRPGPCITIGPVRISIPMDATGSGMTSIEIAVEDGLVTVKLCLNAMRMPGDVSQQLLAAAGQLGQTLQTLLPGRRIKILQSAPAVNDTPDEIARLSNREGSALSAYGLVGGYHSK